MRAASSSVSQSRPMYAAPPAMVASAMMNDHLANDCRLRSDDEMYAEAGSSRRPSSPGGRVSGSAVRLTSYSSVDGMPCVRSGSGNGFPSASVGVPSSSFASSAAFPSSGFASSPGCSVDFPFSGCDSGFDLGSRSLLKLRVHAKLLGRAA